jgi:hypothetical protein
MRRLLREAINTVRAGGIPVGVAPSYYDLYCALQVLPRDADCSGCPARVDLTAFDLSRADLRPTRSHGLEYLLLQRLLDARQVQ